MRILLITMLVSVLSFLGCKPKYSTEQQPKTAAKINLTGMPTEKVVKTKYDNLKVVCGMDIYPQWTDAAISLARAEWNILSEFNDMKSIELASEISESSLIQVKVHLDRLQIAPNLTLKDENGAEYVLKNSPTLQAKVEWRQTIGSTSQSGRTARIALIEGLPSELLRLNTSTENSAEAQHKIRIHCQTVAGPKPEYQSEFQKR